MPKVQSLRTHLVTELRELLGAEQQLTKVLRDLAERASTPALRTAFEAHSRETEGHIDRLTEAFEALEEPAQPKRCEGIQGLIREADAVISSTPPGALRDAVMITSAQKVEHYEMASYGTARTYAQVLGQPRVARLLQETLEEEQAADAKLTEIAEGKVNENAAEEWHQDQAAAGLLEQTAALAGQAVGIGARTVKRAADAIGLGLDELGTGRRSATPVRQVASTLNRTVAAATDTLSDVADSAASHVRRLVQPIAQSARKMPGGNSTVRRARSQQKGNGQRSQTRPRKTGGK